MPKKIKRGKTIVVVGGQYGSESKGMIIGHLAVETLAGAVVRTGAINAGHTVYYKGKPYPMQQIPVGWIVHDTKLIVGRAAYVHFPTLLKECDIIEQATGRPVKDRILVDANCFVHKDEYIKQEHDSGLHHKMGSTGEGVGAAIVAKIKRDVGGQSLVKDFYPYGVHEKFTVCDTLPVMNEILNSGKDVIVEGTQGTLLDVHYGDYPYVTSRQTTAAAWLAEAGLPIKNVEVHLVIRTYPIRVAGNSGRFANEIGFEDLWKHQRGLVDEDHTKSVPDYKTISLYEEAMDATVRKLGLPDRPHRITDPAQRNEFRVQISEFHKVLFEDFPEIFEKVKPFIEMTTVTKKVRRIAKTSPEDLQYSCSLNAPKFVWVNFINYEIPNCYGETAGSMKGSTRNEVYRLLKKYQRITGARVLGGSTSKTTLFIKK